MGPGEITCPICSADIPLSGDESAGEDIFCVACGTQSVLRTRSDDEFEAEEDV